MGWLGNLFLILGAGFISKTARWPFVCTIIGELLWLEESYYIHRTDMIVLCLVFTGIAFYNYIKWKTDDATVQS